MRRMVLLIPLTVVFTACTIYGTRGTAVRGTTVAYGHAGFYPSIGQVVSVQQLVHELENAARHVHQRAEAEQHHFTPREQRALRALHALERRARHFHQQVESYRQNPAHTYDDFQDLVQAYMRAADAVRGDLHGTAHVRADFGRVEILMGQLIDYYGGDDYYARRYPGYFEVGIRIERR